MGLPRLSFLSSRPRFLFVLAFLMVIGVLYGGVYTHTKSVELGFAEASPRGALGGEVVPASCNSFTHLPGTCTTACWQTLDCGKGCYYNVEVNCAGDQCYNFSGNQTSVPMGYTRDSGTGNCAYTGCPYGYHLDLTTFTCTNAPPIGSNDGATVDDNTGVCTAYGWTVDSDTPYAALYADLYVNGPAGSGTFMKRVPANVCRQDLVTAGVAPNCEHGYSDNVLYAYRDGVQHSLYTYGIDSIGGPNTSLSNNPRYFTCLPPPPTNMVVSCNQAGTQMTYSWTSPSSYFTAYYTRAQVVSSGTNTQWDENFVGTSKTITVTPGVAYNVWVNTKHPSNGAASAGLYAYNQTCYADYCANIAGNQASVPYGYYASGNNCYLETCSLTATPSTIDSGGSTSLAWSCSNSSSASSNFTSPMAGSGSISKSPASDTTYTLQCATGCATQTTVTVKNPTLSISSLASRVRAGTSTTISWSATDVTSCTLTGPNVSQSGLTGSVSTGTITDRSTYVLTCQTAQGSRTASVSVTVLPTQTEI